MHLPPASRSAPLRLGLTGGIGSGKSTVAALLADCGAVVIDADAISRQTTATGGAAIEALRATFGPAFITADGALDRMRMRQQAFADPSTRQQLETIIHPLVQEQTQSQIDAATAAGAACIVLDIPLLVESSLAERSKGRRHWREKLDRILVVDCTPTTQLNRVVQRSGLSRAEVEAIIAQQVSRAQRLQAADHVICNEGISLAQLGAQVQRLATWIGL